MYVQILLRESNFQFDKLYTYHVPLEFQKRIALGQRILLPFGRQNRRVEGIVFRLLSEEERRQMEAEEAGTTSKRRAADKSIHYKDVLDILDEEAVLRADQLALCQFLRQRYACTYGAALRLMYPQVMRLRKSYQLQLTEEGRAFLAKAKERRVSAGAEGKQLQGQVRAEEEREQQLFLFLLYLSSKKGGKLKEERLLKEQPLEANLLARALTRGLLKRKEILHKGRQVKGERWLHLRDPEEAEHLLISDQLQNLFHFRLLQLLLETEEIREEDCLQITSASSAQLQQLIQKGWIVAMDQPLKPRSSFAFENIQPVDSKSAHPLLNAPLHIQLTEEQERVFQSLWQDFLSFERQLHKDPLHESLLHGITGSGKTEIYLALAKAVLQAGRSVLLLVPEIALTPQMAARVAHRLQQPIAVLHSRLTVKERYEQWRGILKGEYRIVLGTRSALFAPLKDLGLIILDEEHDPSYFSDCNPRYDARVLARFRARESQALLLLGSATPSVETYYRIQRGKSRLYTLQQRAVQSAQLPEIHLVDMQAEKGAKGEERLLSLPLQLAMEEAFRASEQVLLLLNRRGFVARYACKSCYQIFNCERCALAYTYHKSLNKLVCHCCGQTKERHNLRCPNCGGEELESRQVGIQQLEDSLRANYPGLRLLRMDQDTTSQSRGHEAILSAFGRGEADVLLGTQMIAKGHDFPLVTVVGILQAENGLFANDFRSSERHFQLLTQAAGRAGRGERRGKVFIQSTQLEASCIQCSQRQDYQAFYEEELRHRELLGYPPFTSFLQIFASSADLSFLQTFLTQLHADLAKKNKGKILLYAPCPSPLDKRNNRYFWQLSAKSLHKDALLRCMHYVAKLKLHGDLRLTWTLDL